MTQKTPPPQPTAPMVDIKTGLVSKEWMRFFLYFFFSEDATEQTVVNQTTQINALSAAITNLTAILNQLASDLSTLSLFEDLSNEVNIVNKLTDNEQVVIKKCSIEDNQQVIIKSSIQQDNSVAVKKIEQGHIWDIQKIINKIEENNGYTSIMNSINTYNTDYFSAADSFGDTTPILFGSTNPGVNTYSTHTTHWTRVGGYIELLFAVELSVFDSTSSGVMKISGLPVPASVDSIGVVSSYCGITLPAGSTNIFVKATALSDELTLEYSNTGSSYVLSNASDITGAPSISGYIRYRS